MSLEVHLLGLGLGFFRKKASKKQAFLEKKRLTFHSYA
jgi:hypothetical protein